MDEKRSVSILNKNKSYDTEQWVVSIFNSGGIISPHAVLLVEGRKAVNTPELFTKINYFVGQYDIFAITAETDDNGMSHILNLSPTQLTPLKNSLKNVFANQKGVILKINCRENVAMNQEDAYTRPKGYPKDNYFSISYKLSRAASMAIIDKVKEEAKDIEDIKRSCSCDLSEAVKLLPRYQFRGEKSSLGQSQEGVNCMEWCVNMLNIGFAFDGKPALEASRPPKPPCTLL